MQMGLNCQLWRLIYDSLIEVWMQPDPRRQPLLRLEKIEDVYEDGFLVPNTSTLPPPALYEGLGVINSEECPLFSLAFTVSSFRCFSVNISLIFVWRINDWLDVAHICFYKPNRVNYKGLFIQFSTALERLFFPPPSSLPPLSLSLFFNLADLTSV